MAAIDEFIAILDGLHWNYIYYVMKDNPSGVITFYLEARVSFSSSMSLEKFRFFRYLYISSCPKRFRFLYSMFAGVDCRYLLQLLLCVSLWLLFLNLSKFNFEHIFLCIQFLILPSIVSLIRCLLTLVVRFSFFCAILQLHNEIILSDKMIFSTVVSYSSNQSIIRDRNFFFCKEMAQLRSRH